MFLYNGSVLLVVCDGNNLNVIDSHAAKQRQVSETDFLQLQTFSVEISKFFSESNVIVFRDFGH